MRFDPSLRVDIDGSMEIAAGEMEDQVSVCGGNQSIIRGEVYEATNHFVKPSFGSLKGHSSEW